MVDLFDFDPGGLRVKAAIAHFKAYLQRRYPDRSTGKHYISDLTIFSQFVGKTSPRDITVCPALHAASHGALVRPSAPTSGIELSTLARGSSA